MNAAPHPAPNRRRARPWLEWALTLPSLLWLAALFLLPTALVAVIALKPPTPNGGIGPGWTLDTLRDLAQPAYPAILWRTLWISAVTTAICILVALPVACWIVRFPPRARRWILLLIILPFWTNSLIRIFAWQTLLHAEGPLKRALVALGLLRPEASLLFNVWAVLVVLVYTYLPFAILPIYAAAEKFDSGLIDAARDLGASRARAFRKIFLPAIRGGLVAAVLVVLIPALGSYAIPDLVGGTSTEMIGNKIAQRVFTDRNLPHASGLATILALAAILPIALALFLRPPPPGTARQRAAPGRAP